jgi:hypothetical protein
MSINFKWSVNNLQVVQDNFIVKVDLTVTATDGQMVAAAAYTRTLTRGNSFIPYHQLTEQQVLDWCFAPEVITWADKGNAEQSITRHLKDEGEAQVTRQIQSQLNQKQSEPDLPWLKISA